MTTQELIDILLNRGWKRGRYQDGKLIEKTNDYYTSPTRNNISLYAHATDYHIYVCASNPIFIYTKIDIEGKNQTFEVENNLLYIVQYGVRIIAIDIS